MFLRKNIWTIFYLLMLLGGIYLISSIWDTWQETRRFTSTELSYINRIFSSSVTSSLDQQEIVLSLTGDRLLNDNLLLDESGSRVIFDRLLQQNRSLVASGLANIDGRVIAGSSNMDLTKIPNLKTGANTKESFARSLQENQMVVGKTYYFEPAESWLIPMRKAIRDKNDRVIGVMIAGTKPDLLLPMLNEQQNHQLGSSYQVMLVQDFTFNYSYINGLKDYEQVKLMMSSAIPDNIIQLHDKAIQQQPGLSLSELRKKPLSVEYFAQSTDGQTKLFSIMYLPKYRMWSITMTPRSDLIKQVTYAVEPYVFSAVTISIILFFLFNAIDKSEKLKRAELIDQTNHDFLTGLNNRHFLKNEEANWIYPEAPSFTVFFIDLDNFKNINDSYGHSYGDLILQEVAERLRGFFSESQIICRQGGDEFIILSSDIDKQKLDGIAQGLLNTLSRPYRLKHFHFVIGASIGISHYPDDGDDFETLFSAADNAMYKAKGRRNSYFVFTQELRQQSLKTSRIEQALHGALGKNEFSLVYQPQIDKFGKLYGIEALARWQNEEFGAIAPTDFIRIAEDCGFIITLGDFIVEKAMADLAQIQLISQSTDLQLSINVSIRQLQEEDIAKKIGILLKKYQLSAQKITLEITESIFIDDYEYLMPVLDEIRQLGCQFSLDDFGTGYSSLSMLRNLPISELKIDKSFIDQMFSLHQNQAIVLNIINIAKNLGLKVVAEGIETTNQSSLLIEFGCDIQQGYLFAKPLPFDELLNFQRSLNMN